MLTSRAFGPAIGLFVAVVSLGTCLSGQELIERTVAIVGGHVITLADVRTAIALRLVETEAGHDPIDSTTLRLIDRALMLREVQHYAPPEPPDLAVEQRVAFSRERFASLEAFRIAMDAGGFSDERLRAWIRDDLRIAAYLDQRFAAAGMPNDQEVLAYYKEHRSEFDRGGVSLDAAVPLIRERLAGERRRELITDWLSDLRRRTEIVRISDGKIDAGRSEHQRFGLPPAISEHGRTRHSARSPTTPRPDHFGCIDPRPFCQ